ncbi:MAG: hypothetical protein ACYDGR_11245 [Candidatus Dormibacteria bacterium]
MTLYRSPYRRPGPAPAAPSLGHQAALGAAKLVGRAAQSGWRAIEEKRQVPKLRLLTADRLNENYRDREKFAREIRQLSGWLGRPIQVGGDRSQGDVVRLVEVEDGGKRKLRMVLTDAGVSAISKKLGMSMETVPSGVIAQGNGVLVQRRAKLPSGRVVDAYGRADGATAQSIMDATSAANRAIVYQALGIGRSVAKRDVPMDFVTRDWVHNPARGKAEKAKPAKVVIHQASVVPASPAPHSPNVPAVELTAPDSQSEMNVMATGTDVAEIRRAATERGVSDPAEISRRIEALLPETKGVPLGRLTMDEASKVMASIDAIFEPGDGAGFAGMFRDDPGMEAEPF